MRKLTILLAAVAAIVATTFFATAASAEFEAPQRSAWGLAGPESTTNSVGTFSALGWTVEESNGFLFVGGKFQNVTNGDQTVNQANFARFSLTGEWDSTFIPNVDRPVLSVATSPDGGLFVGGEVRVYNGTDVGSLTKVDPVTGDIWPGWNLKVTGGTNVIREVTVESDGWAYAVGTFNQVRYNNVPTPVSNIFRFNPATGEPDTTWLPVVTGGSVWDVSVSKTNNSVYVAGWYDTIAGSTRAAVGLDTNDATVLTWDSFQNNGSARIQYGVEATEYGHVWVVGEQHGIWIHDEAQNYEIVKDHVTNCHPVLQGGDCTRRGGAYQEIERVGDRIYATCHCWGHHATGSGPNPLPYPDTLDDGDAGWEVTGSVSGIVAYDVATGERDQSFNPYMAGDIGGFGVAQASDGCLWTTGGYNAVGNPADGPQTPGRDLVRLCDGGDGGTLEAPATCTAVLEGTTIEVTWPEANGAAEYVIYRSVNGENQNWRGKVSGTSFTDTSRSGTLVYYVSSKSADSQHSERTECSFEDNNEALVAPAACTAVENGGSIDVSWPETGGAAEYVIYRSVNGENQNWRGKVSGTSFTDTNRAGALVYYVASKSGAGEISTRTLCTLEEEEVPDPEPVTSCSATADAAGTNATITWPATDEATNYVVYRTVNGGTQFWRGAVDAPATSFSDSLRTGDIEYFVAAKFGNQFTTAVACTPVL